MSQAVRIGNAHGFWGDRLDAAAEMLAWEPDLDFVTLDFLAEVSMSILAMQRAKDPEAGWPRDVVEVVRSLAPYWRNGGRCRFITNCTSRKTGVLLAGFINFWDKLSFTKASSPKQSKPAVLR